MNRKIISLALCVALVFSCFAISNVLSSADTATRGDVNSDGVVDAKDSLCLKKYNAHILGDSDIDLVQADVDGDGAIGIKDVLLLKMYLAKAGLISASTVPTQSTTQSGSLGWNTLQDWESYDLGVKPTGVNALNRTNTIAVVSVSGKNEKEADSTKALSLTPSGPAAKTSSFNPTMNGDPMYIKLDAAKMATATGLRACIKVNDTHKSEAAVAYIGIKLGGRSWYARLTLENYNDFGYYYFVGKTFSLMDGERTYNNDTPETLTLTKETVKGVTQILAWYESEKQLGKYVIDDIDYYNIAEGYDSTAEDNALPQPEKVDGTNKYVALTFDDGPIGFTDKLTEVAKEYNAKFSHFFIGKNFDETDVEPLKRILAYGGEIQNHTWDHGYLTSLSADDIKAQVNEVDTWLNTNVGVKTTMLRPPMLYVNATMYEAVDRVCIAGICSGDWSGYSVDYSVEYYKCHSQNGTILLMHETRIQCVETARQLCEYFSNAGFEMVTTTELFEKEGISNPVHTKMYNNALD